MHATVKSKIYKFNAHPEQKGMHLPTGPLSMGHVPINNPLDGQKWWMVTGLSSQPIFLGHSSPT